MGHTAHAIFSVDSWRLDQRFLFQLDEFFAETGLKVWETDLKRGIKIIWRSSSAKVHSLRDLPLELKPERVHINAGNEVIFFDFVIYANPKIDRYGVWPVSFFTSTKVAMGDVPQGIFSRVARQCHLRIASCKSLGYTTHNGFDEDAYEEISGKYGKYDQALHPSLDYVIINPADYGKDILNVLRDIHSIWADALGMPRPDPFPRELEELANGHLFLSFGGEL